MISERIKRNSYLRNYAQSFFWRTHSQQEIDYVEEEDGQLSAYEFKWNINSKAKEPKLFKETYPESEFQIITPDNYWPFIS